MYEYENANMVIQPEELISLLKAADSFGVENFIIKRSDEFGSTTTFLLIPTDAEGIPLNRALV